MFEKDVRYHFLTNDGSQKRVTLVYFSDRPPTADMLSVARSFFEEAIDRGVIIEADSNEALPPWLKESEERLKLLKRKTSGEEGWVLRTATKRLQYIQTAIQDMLAILRAKDPIKVLNKYARECVPRQNETRFRLWFFGYLAFDKDIDALMPPIKAMGTWDRMSNQGTKKFGKPSRDEGRCDGCRVDAAMLEKILKGYHKFKGLGITYESIYADTLRDIFGCRTTKYGESLIVYHPDGKPFPTRDQFWYHVRKEVGADSVRKTRFGPERLRLKSATSEGSYSENIANLMQKIEADVYYTADRPIGLHEKSTQLPLAVARSTDSLSGEVVGIGLSASNENAAAYRMMLFSMAISKVRFCSLFGIDITPDEWPSIGLPNFYISDRGPGSAEGLIEEFQRRFPISSLTPSYQGQSKAGVESSHPRSTKLEGAPTYIQSNLNVYEMARREILRVIADNKSSDASGRMTPNMIRACHSATPNAIWEYLDSRGRNDAHGMKFEDAVRTFLAPVELQVRSDGLYLRGQRYDSQELRDAGLLEKVAQSQDTSIDGYVLDMAVRTIWAEYKGNLIELAARLPHQTAEGEVSMSLQDLEDIARERRRLKAQLKDNKVAVMIDTRTRYEELTGKEWNAGHRKAGRPKSKTPGARLEAADVKRPGKTAK